VIERDVHGAGAALLETLGARHVDQHAAHLPRGHRQEVLAVLPLHVLDVDQTQVRLVDERGGLQAVAGAFTSHARRAMRWSSAYTVCTSCSNAA
jgi:hypothetical protein